MDERWAEVEHAARYHGQADDPAGRSWWVYRRLHLVYGWCIEIHADAPFGPLIDRRWERSRERPIWVDGLREAIARRGLDAALPEDPRIDDPPAPGGIIVLHGSHGRSAVRGSIDGDGPWHGCRLRWVDPGSHTVVRTFATTVSESAVTTPSRRRSEIVVDTSTVIHVYISALRMSWGIEDPCPLWHRCRLRSLRFVDGRLVGRGDVRRLAS